MDGSWLDQQDFGWNFRLDEMSAALGLAQLQRLDSLLARRRQVADWYGRYFAPLHKQPAFQARWGEVCLPVTEKLAVTGLALPFYTQLTPQEVESVVLTLRQAEECLCD